MFIYGATWIQYMRRARHKVQPRRRSVGAAEASDNRNGTEFHFQMSVLPSQIFTDGCLKTSWCNTMVNTRPSQFLQNATYQYATFFFFLFFSQCQSLLKGVCPVILIRLAVMHIMDDTWKHVLVLKIKRLFMAKKKQQMLFERVHKPKSH